jgi:F-type H+-transporting ATPase subunit b
MQTPVFLTVAAGGEHPIIDFDGTILLQFALFVVMAFAASRLLFRPYLQMREERTRSIDGAREDAGRMSAEAETRLADYEAKLAQARQRAELERRQIRAAAATHQQEVTEAARREATSSIEASRAEVTRQMSAVRAELMPRAGDIAQEIVSKLLGRKVA